MGRKENGQCCRLQEQIIITLLYIFSTLLGHPAGQFSLSQAFFPGNISHKQIMRKRNSTNILIGILV